MNHLSNVFSGNVRKRLCGMLTAAVMLTLSGANYEITLAPQASEAEKHAAQELAFHLEKLSGRSCAIGPRDRRGTEATFHIGLLPADEKPSRPDEVVLRRVWDDFYLSGTAPRGTLYAVYTFLEDVCGMRFFAPDEIVYPKRFQLPAELNYRYAPPFILRETSFLTARKNHKFAVQRKLNGHFQQIPAEWGGHETILGFCHTSSRLMPPEKYGKTHPEFYSEIGGQRRPVGNQLCFSNPEMRRELLKNVLAFLEKNPQATVVSISQDDNNDYCRCAACTALAQKYGNRQSGVILDCINEIAAEVEKKYPRVLVETLAYAYSVDAPENIRPRANVVIRLCTRGDFGRPMNSDANAEFRTALEKWSRLTDKLMVWHYISLFANQLSPNPNLWVAEQDFRFFRDHHVIALFAQSSGAMESDFAPMRAYVISRLLWNPDEDEQRLMEEFLRHYYGEAAFPLLKQYFSLIGIDYEKHPDFQLRWNSPAADFLSLETIEKAMTLMDRAVELSTGKYAERLRTARLSIYFALLMHPDTPKRYADRKELTAKIYTEFDHQTRHTTHYGEALLLAPLKKSLAIRYLGRSAATSSAPLPEELAKQPDGAVTVVEPEDFIAYENKLRTFRIPNGVRMRGDHKGWLIQFAGLGLRVPAPGKYDLYAEVRVTAPSDAGKALQLGYYDAVTKKNVARKFDAEQCAGKEFRLLRLGSAEITPQKQFFYCAPLNNPKVEWIEVGRIFAVKCQ